MDYWDEERDYEWEKMNEESTVNIGEIKRKKEIGKRESE
jgi:hypothetical protein